MGGEDPHRPRRGSRLFFVLLQTPDCALGQRTEAKRPTQDMSTKHNGTLEQSDIVRTEYYSVGRGGMCEG